MSDGTLLVHISEAATRLHCPEYEVSKMVDLGMLSSREIDGRTYIPDYAIEAYSVPDGVTA